MKRARFTEEQIIVVQREHEAGKKTAYLARKHGVSEATLRRRLLRALSIEAKRPPMVSATCGLCGRILGAPLRRSVPQSL